MLFRIAKDLETEVNGRIANIFVVNNGINPDPTSTLETDKHYKTICGPFSYNQQIIIIFSISLMILGNIMGACKKKKK